MIGKKIDEQAALGGAVGLSAVASAVGLCCVGPWAVILFNVGGAVFLTRLEPVRPVFLALAGVALAWAFYRVYRPEPVRADGSCRQRSAPVLKALLWISLAIFLVALFAPRIQGQIAHYFI